MNTLYLFRNVYGYSIFSSAEHPLTARTQAIKALKAYAQEHGYDKDFWEKLDRDVMQKGFEAKGTSKVIA